MYGQHMMTIQNGREVCMYVCMCVVCMQEQVGVGYIQLEHRRYMYVLYKQ